MINYITLTIVFFFPEWMINVYSVLPFLLKWYTIVIEAKKRKKNEKYII